MLHGVTGSTTAKLTAGHNVIYSHLERHFGSEAARLYATVNQGAIDEVERLVDEHAIECDFERTRNDVYSDPSTMSSGSRRPPPSAEPASRRRSCVRRSFPSPLLEPWSPRTRRSSTRGNTCSPLLATIPGDGSQVFEQTRATDVQEGEPCLVETDRGTLRARDVVVATHRPILDRGLFFTKVHPHRSYVLAATVADAPRGMYISSETPTHSIRSTPKEDGRHLLVVGGEGRKTGQGGPTNER